MSNGETVVYSDGESSTGETGSLYQLQDGQIGGCSDGDSIPDPFEPPNRVATFMAGTQPTQHYSATAVMIFGSAAGAGRLLDAWTTLLTTEVTADNRDQHNMKVIKLRDQIAQAKEEIHEPFENLCMFY